ncbi:UPF0149 family protein [Phytohalomonas tamaricis]|uniref:UPF0149 family protein n=1 Tax=Phytohalomonas tamaricis TaxID=2081032 RepID=UPI000D0BE792|nr:UPF0149 family protein [Phytohalomonas tamaricis]
MSTVNEPIDFATIGDIFLAHGSLQAPAFLDGRLCAQLALADIDASTWLETVCATLGVEEPRSREDAEVLLEWRRRTEARLSAAEMSYEPLLPDELFSLSERAQGLKEWSQGFTEAVFEYDVEVRAGWSAPLKEALEDIEALVTIATDIEESSENENDLFALTEHARMAAMLLYTEQHPGEPQVEQVSSSEEDAQQTRH